MIDLNNLPLVSDLTTAELADFIGRLDAFSKQVDGIAKSYKDVAKAIIGGAGTISGNIYDVTVRTDVTWNINTDLLKSTYGEDWYFKHSKQGVRVVLSAKPAKASATA